MGKLLQVLLFILIEPLEFLAEVVVEYKFRRRAA